MHKRILIVGASGFLGSKIKDSLQTKASVLGTFNRNGFPDLTHLDAANVEEVNHTFNHFRPHVVVNASGFTNVDQCEAMPELAWRHNVEAVSNLARACASSGAKLIQISTDHFNSPNIGSRPESCSPFAVNQYGFTKLMAEDLILKITPDAIILRTNFFGIGNRNLPSFLNWIRDSLLTSKRITSVEDVFFTPIGVTKLIELLWDLTERDYEGVINISGNESISKLDFIRIAATVLHIDKPNLVPVHMADLNLKASRPLQMSLSNDAVCKFLEVQIPSVSSMLAQELEAFN
jgi:dTDP-4-dehydrorhamnose reductase